jgi:hypothetical protein
MKTKTSLNFGFLILCFLWNLWDSQMYAQQPRIPTQAEMDKWSRDYGFHNHMWNWQTQQMDGIRLTTLAKKEALDSARANIKLLKATTLVVRMRTGSSKVKALEKFINDPNIEGKNKLRYEGMKKKTIDEKRAESHHVMDAFNSKYSFSKVLFMPDTLAAMLKSGVRSGIFLNENLELDTSISLETSFYMGYYGENSSDLYTNIEGITIVDQTFEPLRYPFPSFVGQTGIKRLFQKIFNKQTDLEYFEGLVEKLQKTMENSITSKKD